MLLLAVIKNTRGHYAHQKFYVYNQSPVPIWTFRPTTWLSDRRNINACDSRNRCEKRYCPCCTGTGKIIEKTLIKSICITETPIVEVNAVKNFLKNIKYFIFKDTMLF